MSKADYSKVLRHEEASRLVQPQDMFMAFTPGEHNMGGEMVNGVRVGKDWFGCSWSEFGDSPLDGATITPGTQRLEDLEDFASVIPTAEQVRAFDWEGYTKQALANFDRENQVLQVRSLVGFFERMHCLIGFEDALCAFYEEPETVHEFFQAMLEYKKEVATCVAKYMKPEIIIFDDDYGTMRSTFLSPEMWRSFFPQYWKELVDHVHSLGMMFELHSCGYITPLVGDFVAAGMDILQPLQTNNDLRYIKENYGKDLILRLAIFDKQMEAMGMTEDEVRAQIQEWYHILAPGGNFVADLVPIQDRFYEIQAEEQAKFEKEFYHL